MLSQFIMSPVLTISCVRDSELSRSIDLDVIAVEDAGCVWTLLVEISILRVDNF